MMNVKEKKKANQEANCQNSKKKVFLPKGK
jgi:hypothetical protein